jgi:hypothetical protein
VSDKIQSFTKTKEAVIFLRRDVKAWTDVEQVRGAATMQSRNYFEMILRFFDAVVPMPGNILIIVFIFEVRASVSSARFENG